MSVLIKGIKMPKCCADCPCFYDFISCQALSDGTDDFSASGFDEFRERLPNCPLVEVPTPHGSLIDAAELSKWINVIPTTEDGGVDINDLEEYLDRAPVIIEAEEE